MILSRSINLDNKEQVQKFIAEASIQYDDVTKKTKEFKKHEKFLADKVIAADLGIKKTVNDISLKHTANTLIYRIFKYLLGNI